ncbi:MAG TPA: hypothetical protein DCM45_06355 [Clostridiales bacterium]|nr:hypothetical protein [Clostridiales bacterium]
MNIEQILTHLAHATYVPFTLIRDDRETFHSPELTYLPNLTALIHAHALPLEKDVILAFTEELLCIGFIRIKNTSELVIMGPVSSIPCNNRRAQQILRRYGIPSTQAGDLLGYFSNTPKLSLLKFANLLIFANYILNQETLEIMDLLPDEYHLEKTDDTIPAEQSAFSEDDLIHDSQEFEKKLYSLVKYGNTKELNDLFDAMPFSGNVGVLANDLLRNAKNLIICSITMTSRAAVEGGLDYESSLRHADAYLQKVEMAPDVASVYALHQNMLKTFTSLVAKRRIGNPDSPTAVKIYNYVEQHLYRKINEQEIADALGLSRPYLCTQFKRETGMNLNDFITRVKIDEARSLLTTTNKSASEIATMLDFSSQSYFQAVFKKTTGMTPKQYRTSHYT